MSRLNAAFFHMSFFMAADGTRLFYRDWGSERPVVFCHAWPQSSDAWEHQMLFLWSKGFRVVAHDRRGHGHSWGSKRGNDINTYADDLAALLEALDLRDAVLVGHAVGACEIVRYLSRHGTSRIRGIALLASAMPRITRSPDYPRALPAHTFEELAGRLRGDRHRGLQALAVTYYGATGSARTRDRFVRSAMASGDEACLACLAEMSAFDSTRDLRQIRIPTLLVHGDHDQMIPIEVSSRVAARLMPHARLKVYADGEHGIQVSSRNRLNADLLSFAAA